MRRKLAISTALSACVALLPQVSALLLLTPTYFGQFSLLYLLYAFGISISLSTVAEPWHREILDRGKALGWPEFSTASLAISALSAPLSFGIAAILGLGPVISAVAVVSIGLAIFRTKARYFLAQRNQWNKIIIAEGAFIGLFVFVLSASKLVGVGDLDSIFLSWLISTFTMLGVSRPVRPKMIHLKNWVNTHKKHFSRLLGDSLLMDSGAIFIPLLIIAPILGVHNFGTYRGVSNVAVPVRLILNPLRPQIAEKSRTSSAGRLSTIVFIVAALVGLLVGIPLIIVGNLSFDVGVLTSLAPFWIAVITTVAATFVSHFFYIRCRVSGTAKQLLGARVIQTLLLVIIPASGAFFFGMEGAIWGLAGAELFTAVTWFIVDRMRNR